LAGSRASARSTSSGQRPRQVGALGRERGSAGLDQLRGLDDAAAPERVPPGEALVEDDADGPDVRCGGRLLAAQPLGRDVRERPGDVAGRRQRLLVRELRQPEVEQAGAPVVGAEQDVGRLHVAVDDAARVRVRETVEGLRARLDELGVLQVAPAHGLAQRRPGHVLVGDVDVVAVARERVGAQTVRVAELRRRARLALGPRAGLALACHDLERDVEPVALVAGEPDRP